MAQITINATKRTVSGKPVKKLRNSGKLPAVVYGHNVKSENIEVSESEFLKTLKQAGESTIITLSVDGKNHPVLIHDVHNHYLTDRPIHVDFYAVNMDEKLKATVQLHFIGESQAVKALGGVLARNLSELEVECLPADLPSHFEVDISSLNTFEDSIRVSDLNVSDKVKILANPEEVIIAVTPPRSEEDLKELDQKVEEVDVNTIEGVAKPEAPAEGEAAEEKKE
ncbi:MAG TPA: 50S ribosomal protein L25/general stress protein Ctc [Candidatus Binatia bacterium]|nr:50S ribosomal protein L25/general stress protein Ctc [Candidatus Binatia bacterium]